MDGKEAIRIADLMITTAALLAELPKNDAPMAKPAWTLCYILAAETARCYKIMTANIATMRRARAFCVTALILFALPFESVFAYLDPGTGSMLLQVILGGVAAATVALKLYWQRIKQALGLAKPTESGEDADPGKSPE